ncbi:MAG: flagellar export chaperone FlgN [Ignavibacteriae bacterium]|nr:flagellar export chaperone FlgN [Ignavibacteriota bacterium]
MKLEKLIAVLDKQEDNLKKLLQSVLEKQTALVNGKSDLIKESVSKEEKILLAVQLTEETRLKVMEDLFVEFKIENKRYKLEVLVENLTGKINKNILENISLSERRIKITIREIQKINHQNMVLIQQSRSIINDTITAVLNSKHRSIVDRKG